MLRKSLALAIILLLVLGVVAGCGQQASQQGGDQQQQQEKEIAFTISAEVPNLDPQKATDTYAILVGNAIFEGLIRVHGDGNIQPGMAEKWDVSEDKKTWTFHLRDAKWSDGTPVTAYDFEYAFKRLLDPNTASEYSYQGYYILNGEKFNKGEITDPSQVGVKALDEKTLEIKLENPVKYFESLMSFLSFMPVRKDFVEKMGEKFAADADKLLYNGPFILKEWKHEQELILEKNPNYWNKDAIKIDRVKIYIVNDPNTAYQMYENGETDWEYIPPELVEQVAAEGKAKYFYDGAEFYLQFNVKRPGKPWLANENFQRAVGFAIDREALVKSVMKGVSDPATRYVLPQLAGLEKKFVEEYPYEFYSKNADTAKAKEYLEKAMKELNISDPSKLTFEYLTDDTQRAKLTAEIIQDQLKQNLGIEITVKQVPFKQRLELMNKRDYDVVFAGWGPDYDDPMTYIDMWVTGGGHNNTGWSNKEYDELVKFAKTTDDFKKRADAMFEAEKLLMEKGPIVPVYFRQRAWVCGDHVKGLVTNFVGPTFDFVYADVEK
ncbi:peptide ABC transporter substrate-binding protein [Thermosediminibacter litoriperuensis]|uniref:Oligopeptide transport system substrate-binding protein n=1 Tax=Thermosediminibacter litoriperuensis TaxID=291989 RepID=A0A5S5AW73_9FIRM|nr:peptide ABC transporter substrate-binding protein [Thermosediminibacter litoriperuensis]TYP56182.1 oligopeptide transport system substrate-binding protein [Thermosediminibacter litoriperuensis]